MPPTVTVRDAAASILVHLCVAAALIVGWPVLVWAFFAGGRMIRKAKRAQANRH